MRKPVASLDALVHPHQIEVQEFDSYALVIDARRPEAYQEDHIPGAVNVPVPLSPSEAEAGIATLSVRESAPVLPYVLASHARGLSAGAEVLVYCDRGGLDALVWAEPLRRAGFVVDVLPGGWGNYRRWVEAGLEAVPRALSFRPLIAAPVSGLSRVVARLRAQGEQVVDVTALAGQRLVPGLTLSGDAVPSQARFESALLAQLRRMNPQRPVWIRIGRCGLGDLALPPSLREAVQGSRGARVVAALPARAVAWRDCLRSKGADARQLLAALSASRRRPKSAELQRWRQLTDAGREVDALAEIITHYVEPSCLPDHWDVEPQLFQLDSLDAGVVSRMVDQWRVALSAPGLDGRNG